MERSCEKSLFLHRERDVWDRIVEEARLCGELTAQLAATHQRVAELAPAAKKVANLQIREADVRRRAIEAEEKAATLVERARKDDVEAERVRKERDDLLRVMVRLHAEHDSTRKEHDDACGWVNNLRSMGRWTNFGRMSKVSLQVPCHSCSRI
jgi:hypothetical protein